MLGGLEVCGKNEWLLGEGRLLTRLLGTLELALLYLTDNLRVVLKLSSRFFCPFTMHSFATLKANDINARPLSCI